MKTYSIASLWLAILPLVVGALSLQPQVVDSARRAALASSWGLVVLTSAAEPVLLKGTVSLRSDAVLPEDLSTAALYITARPDRPDNVPQAILSGTRGKPPPVLIARLAHLSEFPVEFALTSADVSVEGDWWYQDDLIVSARLDSDGVAATRDPNDLVGRGLFRRGTDQVVQVELQGRGVTGKLLTGKK